MVSVCVEPLCRLRGGVKAVVLCTQGRVRFLPLPPDQWSGDAPGQDLRERAVLAPRLVDPNDRVRRERDMLKHARAIGIALIVLLAITAFMYSAPVRPAWADEIDDDAAAALRSLYEGSPAARVLGERAVAIL